MRIAALVLVLVAFPLFAPKSVQAGRVHVGSVHLCEDEPVLLGPRHSLGSARLGIVTEDRAAELLLTRRLVVIQLSDRTLRKIDREIAREKHEDDGWLESIIKSAVLGSVRDMLDHSLECPIEDLHDVRYRHGRLILITEDGDRIFEDINVNGHEVLEGFSGRDARAFVREFRRVKERRL